MGAEYCRIERWRGYVASSFYVRLPDRTVLESHPFRWRRSAAPPHNGSARAAYEELVARLEQAGWLRHGDGTDWFATTFMRVADVRPGLVPAAPPVAIAAPPSQPPPPRIVERPDPVPPDPVPPDAAPPPAERPAAPAQAEAVQAEAVRAPQRAAPEEPERRRRWPVAAGAAAALVVAGAASVLLLHGGGDSTALARGTVATTLPAAPATTAVTPEEPSIPAAEPTKTISGLTPAKTVLV